MMLVNQRHQPVFSVSPPLNMQHKKRDIFPKKDNNNNSFYNKSNSQLLLLQRNKVSQNSLQRILSFKPKNKNITNACFFPFDIYINAARQIQRCFRGFNARRKYFSFRKLRQNVIKVQKRFRAYMIQKDVKLASYLKFLKYQASKISKAVAQFDRVALKLQAKKPKPVFLKAVYKLSKFVTKDIQNSQFLQSGRYEFPRRKNQMLQKRGRQMNVVRNNSKKKNKKKMENNKRTTVGYGYSSSSRSPDYSTLRGGYSSQRDTNTTKAYTSRQKSNSREKKKQKVRANKQSNINNNNDDDECNKRIFDLPKQMNTPQQHKPSNKNQDGLTDSQKLQFEKSSLIRKSRQPKSGRLIQSIDNYQQSEKGQILINMVEANLSQEVRNLQKKQDQFKRLKQLSSNKKKKSKKDQRSMMLMQSKMRNFEQQLYSATAADQQPHYYQNRKKKSGEISNLLQGIQSLKNKLTQAQQSNISQLQNIMETFREDKAKQVGGVGVNKSDEKQFQ